MERVTAVWEKKRKDRPFLYSILSERERRGEERRDNSHQGNDEILCQGSRLDIGVWASLSSVLFLFQTREAEWEGAGGG